MEEFDYVAVDDLVKMFVQTSPNIKAIQIKNEYSQIIAHYPTDEGHNEYQKLEQNLYNQRSSPAKYIGSMSIQWSVPNSLLNRAQLYEQILIFGLAFMIILSIMIYHYLAFSIVKPLNQLEKKLLEMNPGEQFRRPLLLPREIRSLQDHYLSMVDKVYKQIEHLKLLASTDGLTKLPNRSAIETAILQMAAQALLAEKTFAVLFLDIDHFKKINDVHGHDTGDLVLSGFANVLQRCMPEQAVLGRFGGDEFVMLIPDADQQINSVITQIYNQLDCAYIFAGQRIYMSTSIGVALCPSAGNTPETLLKAADLALYQSKETGRNRVSYYQPRMSQDSNHWLNTIDFVRSAFREKRYTCCLQPITDQDKCIRWNEILFRLIDHEGKLITANDFMCIAEENGLMKHIAEASCQFVLKLLKTDCYPKKFALNLSRSQILLQDLQKIIAPLLPWKSHIIIEVTEEAFLGETRTHNVIKSLRDQGFTIALDDFGSGYSSLSALLNLPVDIVKLDKQFQTNIQQRDDARAMLESIISLLQTLDKQVVAEGIENITQFEFAIHAGCHFLQGHYCYKPLLLSEYLNQLSYSPLIQVNQP
ncbi:MAG: EAL domain-containing protein [Thiolinea sp.]